MPEFLLEFFSEEIPARMQSGACQQLCRLMQNKLKAHMLPHGDMRCFSTPRRLALVVEGLPVQQEDRMVERKGPRVDAPQPAIQGFLKSCNIDISEAVQEEIKGKGTFLFARTVSKGQKTAEILTLIVEEILCDFVWPKSMRWGDASFTWIRPLHSILPLFQGEALPVRRPHPLVTVGNQTKGHRFLAPDAFSVNDFQDYEQKLEAAYVVLNPVKRAEILVQSFNQYASDLGGHVADYPSLLEEVTGLVEWPEPLCGTINPEHMALPKEVLVTSMRVHQKYFPVVSKEGALLPHFLFASNISGPDKSAAIIYGNEQVLRARLEDARFFWVQDCKASLDGWNQTLQHQLFHQKLGTMLEKVSRLKSLVTLLLPGDEDLLKAAHYCKADLASGMVGEFPELQGLMGGYYALAHDHSAATASAIRTHYLPQGPDDACPLELPSAFLALSDKVDTLVSFFAVGILPTGSKDPFALRRAALGIIRLTLENNMVLDFGALFRAAYALVNAPEKRPLTDVVGDLDQFLLDRLRHYLKTQGFRHDHIAAVLTAGNWQGGIVLAYEVLKALRTFSEAPIGQDLITSYKRAANIVVQAEQTGMVLEGDVAIQRELFQTAEEKNLLEQLCRLDQEISAARLQDVMPLADIFEKVAALKPALDVFFDNVTVNHEDPTIKENRLNILFYFRHILGSLADFSKIEK